MKLKKRKRWKNTMKPKSDLLKIPIKLITFTQANLETKRENIITISEMK